MKVVFIGGGAHRLLGILRKAMSDGLFNQGEIYLCNRNSNRAEVMGRLLMLTPEYQRTQCQIKWGSDLQIALEGADAVGVILMAGSQLSFRLGDIPAWEHGYASSDNISPNGAILAVKTAPILMKIARHMEAICPNAWLINFANPIAPLTGMIWQFTTIKAVGVCAGYINHQWDLNRLMGQDRWSDNFEVTVAGVNHLSYILEGSVNGQNLFEALDCAKSEDWQMPYLGSQVAEADRPFVNWGITFQAELFRELDVLVFSTEVDGQCHLRYDDQQAFLRRNRARPTALRIHEEVAFHERQQENQNAAFEQSLSDAQDPAFWNNLPKASIYLPVHSDIFLKFLSGLNHEDGVEVVTTQPNGKAIANLPENVVVETTQIISKQGLKVKKEQMELPSVVYGLTASLAMHQTLLGEACGAEDPELLKKALLCYPIRPYSNGLKKLFKELLAINHHEIPEPFKHLSEELRLR